MNTTRFRGVVICKSVDKNEIRIIEIRFMCIPGIKPVIVPKMIPRRRVKMREVIIERSM